MLSLYKYLFPEEDFTSSDVISEKWSEIIDDKKITCLISYENKIPVATCILTIIPNLTRKQKSYSVVENVVTHSDYRNKGYGKAIMMKAVAISKDNNCYKVMLMSNSKRIDAHKFYNRIGFDSISKKGFQYRISN
ncbi:MAG: GNAT family N-acetyltransferase [bacterium]|nr:GNAT family N-acetyltransferase [bacterium]